MNLFHKMLVAPPVSALLLLLLWAVSYQLMDTTALAVLILATFGSIGAGFAMARGISRRVAQVTTATRRIAAGDLQKDISREGDDEVAEILEALHGMQGRGWVDYQFMDPISKKVRQKSGYSVRLPGYDVVIAVGIYKD